LQVTLKRDAGAAGCGKLRPLRPRSPGIAHANRRYSRMRGILLWLVGIPIPIIIALYLFGVL
jgi:hypothetical protein